jgi:hypothetical protein
MFSASSKGEATMRASDVEFSQIWLQVQHWPAERRRTLAEHIAESLRAEVEASAENWTEAKNARRCELIDKDIQKSLTAAEKHEMDSLTEQLRAHRRRVAPIPIKAAQRLHEQLLEKKRNQNGASGGTTE